MCQRIWLNTRTHKAHSVPWKGKRRPKPIMLLGCIKSENWKQSGIVDRTCLDPNPSISCRLMISPQSTCWLIQISRSSSPCLTSALTQSLSPHTLTPLPLSFHKHPLTTFVNESCAAISSQVERSSYASLYCHKKLSVDVHCSLKSLISSRN